MIDFEQAKMLAEATAREELFWIISSSSLIDDYYVESNVCWIFFRRDDIEIPPEHSLRDGAYAISKKGSVRLIAAFEKQSDELMKYLGQISDYFLKHDE